MGAGLLYGFLGGAGQGLANVGAQNQRFDDEMALAQERERLDVEKANRIAEAADARKKAQMGQFSDILKNKLAEQVPLEAPAVAGLTGDSAKAVGLNDGIQGDTKTIANILAQAQGTLNNPSATEEQKTDAKGIIAQIQKQYDAQGLINAKSVEGKTRARTFDEALDAAREDAAVNNATAYMAGEAMFSGERKEKRDEKKLDQQAKMKQKELEQREREYEAKERIANARIEFDRARMEQMADRIASSNNKTMQQSYAITLRQDVEAIDRSIRDLEKQKKDALGDEKKQLDSDLLELRSRREWLRGVQNDFYKESGINLPSSASTPPAQNQKPLNSLPSGAKKVGTSGGKDVYETPDGRRYIQE